MKILVLKGFRIFMLCCVGWPDMAFIFGHNLTMRCSKIKGKANAHLKRGSRERKRLACMKTAQYN
jgi:hypothetical protein